MSDDQNLNTAQPDAFEAALAASATDLATPQVEEVIEEVAAPVPQQIQMLLSLQMKMATSNQMRMIQTPNFVAHFA